MSFIPNTIIVNSILLESYKKKLIDISDLVAEINIYESIYQNTISGTVEILDSTDLIQFFPIIGEEKIHFDLVMPGQDDNRSIKLVFSVYRIADRVIRNDKLQSYVLWFTSAETLTNLEQRISKSWQGKPVSSIVSDILKKYIKTNKTVNIESTTGITSYIAPAINPFKVINHLAASRSINSDRLADFVFFENLTDKGTQFNFSSLGKLMQQTPLTSITYHPVNLTGKIKSFPLNVDEIEFKKSIDTQESRAAGLYNQTVVFYDHLRKKYVVSKTNHADIFSDLKKFHSDGEKSSPLYSKNVKEPMEFFKLVYVDQFPTNVADTSISNSYSKTTEQQPNRSQNKYIGAHGEISELNSSVLKDKVVARRAVLLQEFENNKIYLKNLSGNLAYTVGKTLFVEFPHITHDRDTAVEASGDNENIHISGNYLITKCRHRISKYNNLNYEYKCHLEIAKNSFREPIK